MQYGCCELGKGGKQMSTQQSKINYKAGIYLRLSKDDENSGESASISNQRNIVTEYAKSNNIIISEEYIDDGYSGTNFDRPGFNRMISDVKNGTINCVITKDLSRLGRNSTKTLEFIEEFFPKHDVRYISVIDGYDSLHLTEGNIFAAPFMVLFNEMYARDISNKIRGSFHAKMENGEYIGSFAPYGYKKDIQGGNKNHLIIDPDVSHIVYKIFEMASAGCSPSEIAKYLNNKSIETPAVYRCNKSPHLNIDNHSKRKEWTSSTICKMLKNRVYLGHTIQGKTEKVSFKSKVTKAKNANDWIEVKNTHEPIITEEMFDMARRRCIARRTPPNKDFKNIFSGIAKCADCNRNMTTAPTNKKGCTYNLCCGGYKAYGAKECSNHFIDYDLLYHTILEELRYWLRLSNDDREKIIKDLEQEQQKEKSSSKSEMLKESLKRAEKRLEEVKKLIVKSYEDYNFNIITQDTYITLSASYDDEKKRLDKEISNIKDILNTSTDKSDLFGKFFSQLDEISEIKELTPTLLKKLIDKIEIEQGYYEKSTDGKKVKHQNIKIYYRFIGCIDDTP